MTGVDPPGYGDHLSALRIVLIGGIELGDIEASGKTSSANTILGVDEIPVRKRTSISVKSEWKRFGRHITVVDTPGWWWHYALEDTPKHDQIELSYATSLCHPGPHAFLLVIPVDMGFPSVYKFSLEEHIRVLGDVWKYTLVLFSSNGPFNNDVLESHLKNWPDLQWVIEKCQNRYHILDNKNKSDEFQVLYLTNKIDKMVKSNKGQSFESAEKPLNLEEWRQTIKEAAEKRIVEVESRMAKHLELLRTDSINRDKPDFLNETRIVIVGAQYAARSSSGNTILGREAFAEGSKRTVRSSIQQGIVEGRHVTVVDTPGWYYINPSSATSTMDKLELKSSVSLCPPGPDVILLTVPFATAYNKLYHQAVMEHMMLFGENVWKYTIVLFTRGDWLGDTTPEERIESQGKDLQCLIERCENRYHVFNNRNREDRQQVEELFQKIDELVASNYGSCYEMDRDAVMEIAEKKMVNEENAEKLRLKSEKVRATLKELYKGQKHNFSKPTLVLTGGRESGKSGAGNALLMGPAFLTGITKTFKIRPRTSKSLLCEAQVFNKNVSVVDTPGWISSPDDASVLVDQEIARGVSMFSPGPHAFLLVIPANKPFTKEDREATLKHMARIGQNVWKHTILVFTWRDWLSEKSVEEYIESEGDDLRLLVEKCGYRYHALSFYEGDLRSQVSKLLEKVDELMVRNRGKPFAPEEKQSAMFKLFRLQKTLTEEEWIKREDDLIERMLTAVIAEPDTSAVAARDGSIDFLIPDMSGDTPSEASMSVNRGPAYVHWWRLRSFRYGASSGYQTQSTAESTMGAEAMSEMDYDKSEQTENQGLLKDINNATFNRRAVDLRRLLQVFRNMQQNRRNSF